MNYDLIVHRSEAENEESFGYMCEWGEDGSSPVSIESNPPDVSISTSTPLTSSGGPFTARDAAPPYPIEVNNWQDGAGQESYDNIDSSPEAFRASRGIDVSQAGHLELGPRVIHFDDWWMGSRIIPALGTFFAGFVPDDGDQPLTLRFLHRYTVTPASSSDCLGTTSATSLVVSDASDLADLSISDVLAAPLGTADTACTMGDHLYCPEHNEVVLVSVSAGTTLTVVRGRSGTTASVHDSGCTWYGFNWTPVSFAETEPTQALSALATNGKYVYAAFHNPGSANGSVWYAQANDTADDAKEFKDVDDIVALAYSGGYLYGAQDNYGSVPSLGWFNTASANDFTAISLAGALSSAATTAGLVGMNNYVYWAVTDGSSLSWVYKAQHSTADSFEVFAELPSGFVATCIHAHLGRVYVGGYIDNLATNISDSTLPRYEGMLYLLGDDGVVTRVARLRNLYDEEALDTRVKGLCSAGPYIYVLTNDDTYVYDTTHGGWSHYASTETSTVSSELEWGVDWLTNGFMWDGYPAPDDASAIRTERSGWESGSTGYMDPAEVVVTESPTSPAYVEYPIYPGAYYNYKVGPGKYHRWTISDLPTTQGTIEFCVSDFQSQAGMVTMAGTSKEARVCFATTYAGGVRVAYRAYLGYAEDPTDKSVTAYSWRAVNDLSVAEHVFRLTLSSEGAKLYIDGALALTSGYDELMDSILPNTVVWAVGWPGDSQTDSRDESISYQYVNFTSDGAYPPGYSASTIATTSMKDIATLNGVAIVPIPGNGTSSAVGTVGGWDYINLKEMASSGWLELSTSALHMGSTDKSFTSVTVEHSPLKSGQALDVSAIVDGSPVSASAVQGERLTTVPLGKAGRAISVKLTLSDDDPNRKYADRLRVFRVTSRFFPSNSPHIHTYYLNCRENVQCRTGRSWGYDPENAIRHLFAAADSGESVWIESLFTSDGTDSRKKARIEQVKLYQGPGDKDHYDKLVGTCMVKLRMVDE